MIHSMRSRIFTAILGVVLASGAMAQSSSAGISLGNFRKAVASQDMDAAFNELQEAKTYIDKAMASETESTKPKTWYYAGEIYTSLMMYDKLSNGEVLMNVQMQMMQEPDKVTPELQKELMNMMLANENFDNGLKYWKKHLDMPNKKSKDDYSEEITRNFMMMNMMFIGLGNNALQANEQATALNAYKKSILMMEATGKVDFAVYFNAGLAAEASENWTEAASLFQTCAQKDFEGAISYGRWAKALLKQEKNEEAMKILDEGRAKHGANKDFAIEEANIYISLGNLEKAEGAMQTLIASDPKNPLLHFNVGVIYDNSGEIDKAASAYKKAIELDGNYFDANYNMGAMFFNLGVDYFKKIQDIDDMAKYAEEEKKAKELFSNALPYMEKSKEIIPGDVNTLKILKSIYARLGMNDKFNEVNDLLKN